MVTIVKDPFVQSDSGGETSAATSGYMEPDTKIPPKPKPVFSEVSVNGVAIAEADIMAEAQNHPASEPGKALLLAAQALVVRELLLQEAHRCDVAVSPERSENDCEETEPDALIRELIEQEIDVPSSDEAERRRYYSHNLNRFRSETIYEARHILLASRKAEQEQDRLELAETLITQIKDDPSAFGQLAKFYSDCTSRDQGGNLGQLTSGSTVAEFEVALMEMKAGEVRSEPVRSRFGLHIIALDRIIDGKVLPFEHVQERIGAWLEASSWSRAVSQYISILAGRANIKGVELDGFSSPLVQ